MKRYVLGFIFDEARIHVRLILKNRPAWQAGMLNGVGGHVEPGESPRAAIVREAFEEAGVHSVIEQWRHVAELHIGRDIIMDVYDLAHNTAFKQAHTAEDQAVSIYAVADLLGLRTIPNLQYLIPLCLEAGSMENGYQLQLPVRFYES